LHGLSLVIWGGGKEGLFFWGGVGLLIKRKKPYLGEPLSIFFS